MVDSETRALIAALRTELDQLKVRVKALEGKQQETPPVRYEYPSATPIPR